MKLNNFIETTSENRKYHFWVFLGILVSFSAIMVYLFIPLDIMYLGDDALFHLRRFKTIMEVLRDSRFPVYLDYAALDNYGYATKWFYSDLMLLPFAYIANYIGIVYAYKIMYFSFTVLCGITTYLCVFNIYKNYNMAFITALLYTFCIYRLQDLFDRTAISEAISLTFVPIVFYGLHHIINGNYKKWYIISIGFSLMILTHMLSTYIMFVVVLILLSINYKKLISEKKRFYYLVIAGIASIFLSGYLLFPFAEMILNGYYYFQAPDPGSFVQHNRMPINEVLYGLINMGIVSNYIKAQQTILSTGLVLTICILTRFFIRNKSKEIKDIDVLTIIGLIFVFLCFNFIPWSLYPLRLLNAVQFPWRFFIISSFFFSIAGGYYLSVLLKNKINPKIVYGLLLIMTLSTLIMSSINYKKGYGEKDIAANKPNIVNHYHLISLEYLPKRIVSLSYIVDKGQNITTQNTNTKITNVKRDKSYISFDAKIDNGDVAELPLIYYVGYYANIDGENIPVSESNKGFVEIPIEKSGTIEVSFSGTPIQKYSIYISIISFFLLVIYIVITKYKKKTNA